MKKQFLIMGVAVLFICAGLSGCNEQQFMEKEELESFTLTINANPSTGIIPLMMKLRQRQYTVNGWISTLRGLG